MNFHKATLDNGLTVIAELNPQVYSVALEFVVRTGSRDETAEVNGVSHFLEHMAFKGNEVYTADDINRKFDEIGADSNASTNEELTTFHTAVLPEYLPEAFELLSVLLTPALRETDFDLEKKVILEEIGMYMDSPFWVGYERAMTEHFGGHPLERLILGTNESITALTRGPDAGLSRRALQSREHRARGGGQYRLGRNPPPRRETLCRLAGGNARTRHPRSPAERRRDGDPQEHAFQQHVLSLTPAPSASSPFWPAPQLLSVIVGDSVSSRLYWELVDPGYVEAANLWHHDFEGSGFYGVYLCCDPGSTEKNRERIRTILEDVNKNGVSETELAQAKSKVCSQIVLGSERPRGRRDALVRKLDLPPPIPQRRRRPESRRGPHRPKLPRPVGRLPLGRNHHRRRGTVDLVERKIVALVFSFQ